MIRIFLKNLILIVLINLLQSSYVHSWDNVVTHKDLSEYAAKSSSVDISRGNILTNTGFTMGLDEVFTWSGKAWTVTKWLREGADLEDAGNLFWDVPQGRARFNNHFHNPQKPWESAGLNDIQSGESALLWAQDGIKQAKVVGGDRSWSTIRILYLRALTSATDTERQANFAQMFQGLGQQMHLIQDMSVPYHVRNDAHPLDAVLHKDPQFGSYYFESWAKENRSKINGFASNPQFPEVLLSASLHGLAPITQFYDTTEYGITTPSKGLDIGLAEFTNGNFFSDDTIFAAERYSKDDKHYAPFPKQSSTNLQFYIDKGNLGPDGILPETIIGEDGVPDLGFWITKDKEGALVKHFVKPTYLTNDVYDVFGELTRTYIRTFFLDEQCHNDYAELLVPRAVGYSAGLLNYFFRGDISLEQTPADPATLVIKNNSTSETLNGIFSIYHDKNNIRSKVLVSSLTGSLQVGPGDQSPAFTFNNPASFETGTYVLVFKGDMGNEHGAVAGRVMKFMALEITPPSQYTYGIIDGSIMPQQFTVLKAKVRSPDQTEQTTDGTIQAIARYKIRPDYKPDLSTDPPRDTAAIVYSHSTSTVQNATLSAVVPKEFTFDFSGQPIPAGITDLYLSVVYTPNPGKDAATTPIIGVKDLTEPTQHTFWNLSDRFWLDNQLYEAKVIYSDPFLIKRLQNYYGLPVTVVDPYLLPLKIAYFDAASEANDSASISALPAGSYIRLISLFDKRDENYVRVSFTSPGFRAGAHYGYPFSGSVNQNTSGIFTNTRVMTTRSIKSHFSQGIMSCAPAASIGACPYDGGDNIPPINAAPQRVNILFP